MSYLEKLFVVINIGRGIYGRWLFHRILSGVIAIAVLSIIIATMLSALLIGSLYAAYAGLLYLGLEPQMAFLAIGGLLVAAIIICAFFIKAGLRHLRKIPQEALHSPDSLSSRATEVVDSFIDGLLAK